MAEYIEREKIGLTNLEIIMCKGDYKEALKMLFDKIDSIPAADVRPVVRGRWEAVMLDHERMGCRPTAHYCSECHQITWFRTFFCPNCGADMRDL